MRKFLIIFLIIFSLTGLHPVKADNHLPKAEINAGDAEFKSGSYKLLTPLGNITEVNDTSPNGFSDFVNGIIKILMALGGAITVVMIMVFGIQYMVTGTSSGKSISKDRITTALAGLILIFCSYLILYTINPDLVDIRIGGFQKIKEAEWEMLNPASQYRLGNEPVVNFQRGAYYDKVKSIATEYKIPHCAMQVIIQRESKSNPNVIGHDENAPDPKSISARKKFIESGVKYSGTKFTGTVQSLGYASNFLNDDHKTGNIYSASNPNSVDLGLDWRFSHGVGLMQFTFFPDNGKYKCRLTAQTKKEICPKDMLDPEKAIRAGSELFAYGYERCRGDIENAFKAYGSGNCNSTNSFAVKESRNRKNLYDQCVAQDK